MQLNVLLEGLVSGQAVDNREITSLSLDSRLVQPGGVFFAYPGLYHDGRDFISMAITQGAVAIVAEADHFEHLSISPTTVPIILVPDLAKWVSFIAGRFYGHPSQSLKLIGVTGTNGKTSCSHFIAQALHRAGKRCGVIGTLGCGLYPHWQPNSLTTPDPISLQKILADLKEQGAEYVAMEVTSHSLVQHRVAAIDFTMGLFTNLTRDHLDYHADMEQYARAKRQLFDRPLLQSVLNIDDPIGRIWAQELIAAGRSVLGYGMQAPEFPLPITAVHHIEWPSVGIRAGLHTPWGYAILHNPYLIGEFNLFNLLGVFNILMSLGLPLESTLGLLGQLRGIPGRMEVIEANSVDKPLVLVDYAHTPDALERALACLRKQVRGRLWCVFGCGGNRDLGKRSLMGKVAEHWADYIVLTDDNPRDEDPMLIISDILQGIQDQNKVVVEHDRRRAIYHSIYSAQPDDIVLIAGKGHENYQLIGQEKRVFSDPIEARLALNAKYSSS